MDAEDFILGLRFLLAKVKRQQKDWDEYNIKEVAILNDGILVAQFFDKKIMDDKVMDFATGKSMESSARCKDMATSIEEIKSLRRLNFDVSRLL